MTQNDFSQSELVTHAACHRKWYWQYGQTIKRRGMFNWIFEVGTAFHSFAEAYYKDDQAAICKATNFSPVVGPDVLRTGKWQSQFEFWKIVFPTLCRTYAKRYPLDQEPFEVLGVEEVVTREFMGIHFRGKLDIRLMNRHGMMGMMDHKTASSIDPIGDAMHTKFQFLFYFWLCGLTEGEFTVDWVKKPALRLKKTESEVDFAIRCRDDISDNPDNYFARETVYYTKEEMQQFEKTVLLPKVKSMTRILGGMEADNFLWTDKNLDNCHAYKTPCAFMPLCFEDEALATIDFVKKEAKHEELIVTLQTNNK